jgi:hypothetical protein
MPFFFTKGRFRQYYRESRWFKRTSYPLEYPDYEFAIVIYTFFQISGIEGNRKGIEEIGGANNTYNSAVSYHLGA